LRLEVINTLGQRVHLLHDGELTPGQHRVQWDGSTEGGIPAPSGVYLLRLEGEGVRFARKVVRLQ